jgi:H+-transporting ATPase
LYVLRERHHLWSSRPGHWVLASSAVDIAIVSTLAISGVLMEPLPWRVLAAVFAAAAGFALILDQVKLPVKAAFKVG